MKGGSVRGYRRIVKPHPFIDLKSGFDKIQWVQKKGTEDARG
jgi:hypothetical protein